MMEFFFQILFYDPSAPETGSYGGRPTRISTLSSAAAVSTPRRAQLRHMKPRFYDDQGSTEVICTAAG